MVEALRTSARTVIMNSYAAGHNCEGDIFHGRECEGITLSIDLVLPIVQGSKQSVTSLVTNQELYSFFKNGNKLVLRTGGKTGSKPGAGQAAARSRAEAAAAEGLAAEHCWNCSAPVGLPAKRWLRGGHYFCRVCIRSYADVALEARAAAGVGACDGVTCEGCKAPEGAAPSAFHGKRPRKGSLSKRKDRKY